MDIHNSLSTLTLNADLEPVTVADPFEHVTDDPAIKLDVDTKTTFVQNKGKGDFITFCLDVFQFAIYGVGVKCRSKRPRVSDIISQISAPM